MKQNLWLRRLFFAAFFISTLDGCVFGQGPEEEEGPSDSPLIRAISSRDESLARAILRETMNPNVKDRFRFTALGAAVDAGLSDFVEELVGAGANPNLTEQRNTTPLMQAAWNCNLRAARFLLKHGALLDAVDYDGQNALMQAAWACDQPEMTRFLISVGAHINAQDKAGNTALSLAADNANYQAVRELLRSGAKTEIKNAEGETAESLACGRTIGREKGHDQACELLRSASRGKRQVPPTPTP